MEIVSLLKEFKKKVNTSTSTSNSKDTNSFHCLPKKHHTKAINDGRHIQFVEDVKLVYFDWDQPVTTPKLSSLKLVQVQVDSNSMKSLCFNSSPCYLEHLFIKHYDTGHVKLEGHVLTRNISFQKIVTIRYTLTDWKTFENLNAFYINSKDTEYDRFAFFINIEVSLLQKFHDSVKVSFAIRFESDNTVYWDNNSGNDHNFKLQHIQ